MTQVPRTTRSGPVRRRTSGVGVVRGAGEGQVEDGAGEVGDRDQIAVVSQVDGFLGHRVVEDSAPGEDPVELQGLLLAFVEYPAPGVGGLGLAVSFPLELDGDRGSGGGFEFGEEADGRAGLGPGQEQTRVNPTAGARELRGSPRAPSSPSSRADAPGPPRGARRARGSQVVSSPGRTRGWDPGAAFQDGIGRKLSAGRGRAARPSGGGPCRDGGVRVVERSRSSSGRRHERAPRRDACGCGKEGSRSVTFTPAKPKTAAGERGFPGGRSR